MSSRSDEGRARAEAVFKKQEHQTKQSEKVWAEHVAAGKAADVNRAKLKALRLAKEGDAGPAKQKASKPTAKQTT